MDFVEIDEGAEYDTTLMTYSTAFALNLHIFDEHIQRKARMIILKEEDLQTMCLNVIADNIGSYMESHKMWEKQLGNRKKEYTDFLRRLYSDRLYRMVNRRGKFSSMEIIPFFLTPYWKQVKLCRFHSYFPTLRIIGKAITFLNLQDSIASSDMLTAILCCVPNVVTLNLVNTDCNGSVLALISKACKSLVTLNLGECIKVKDSGIAYLYNLDCKEIGFNSLKLLNINGTKVTEKSIPLLLKYLTSLEYLKYASIEILLLDLYLNDMISDNDTYNLTSFEPISMDIKLPRYDSLSLKDVLTLWTKVCPRVSRVHIKGHIDDDHLELLSKFEHLKALNLDYDSGSVLLSSTKFFRLRAAQLTEINVRCVTLSVADIVKICINLRRLSLERVTFCDFNIPGESKMNALEYLSLTQANLKEDDVIKSFKVLLSSSKNLEVLDLTFCSNFDMDVAECILDSPNLNTLNTSFTDIRPNILDIILASDKIKRICTDGSPHIAWTSHMTHVNANPLSNTCGWKIGSGYFMDIEMENWIEDPFQVVSFGNFSFL